MSFRIFSIPVRDNSAVQDDLNAFLSGHKVMSVNRQWVADGANSFWSFCVDYQEAPGGGSGPAPPRSFPSNVRGKVDYREVLSPPDFAVFARLRDLRKALAQAEAVPVYTIFTNEQLANLVKARATTREAMEKVTGVGDARVAKFGPRILELLQGAWVNGNATDGPAV